MTLYRIVIVGVCLAICGCAVYGQQTTGEITGTVTDVSGAVIPNATVTATNVATQQVRTTASSATGDYAIPYLTPGTYNVQASMTGFKVDKAANLNLTVGAVLRMDFKLEVGAVSQQVEVTTAAPLISTESTAVQQVVEKEQITALPLNGRDYLQLVALSPNVEMEVGVTGSGVGLGGTRALDLISVAGQRLEYNHYTLDGIENTEPNYKTYIIHPSVDALQQFSVLSGVYSAEYGLGAAQINATTLPGGNTYHGTAYDFLRNDAADARIWLQTGPKNPFHRQDYGFVLDGPLSIPRLFNAKNKLFFASSFEVLRDNETLRELASVPTQDMINGDFNDKDPGEEPIYWPQSQVFSGASKGACQISSGGAYNATTHQCTIGGTLNVLPAGSITAQAQKLLSLWPLPNQFGGAAEESAYANDYVVEQPNLVQETQFNQRVDWTMSQKSNLFGRFSWENDADLPASAFGLITATVTNSEAKQVVIGHTYTINSHMVNEARAGWDHFYNDQSSPYANGSFDPQASLGINGITAKGPQDYGYPSVSPTGMTGYGGTSPYITTDNLYIYSDSLTLIRGHHTMTAGGMFEADQFNELGNQFGTGTLGFSGQATLNPALGTTTSASGFGLADMELGIVSGGFQRISALSNVELRSKKYAAFFQDDWKVRPNLTLNLGIRYDNIRPWYDKHDNIWGVQLSATNPVSILPAAPYTEPLVDIVPGVPLPIYTRPGPTGCNFYGSGANTASLEFSEPGQPVQCGDQYMGRSMENPNNENFGPRVGIDYALGAKTSIRSGFGLYYVTDIGEQEFDMGRNLGGKDGDKTVPLGIYPPLSAPWSIETASAACGPNQYNGGVTWTGLCEAAPQFNGSGQNNRTAYTEQFLLNVQRQLTPNIAVEIGYEGNESHHLLRYYMLNQPVPLTGPTDTRTELQRTPWPSMGLIQMETDWDRGSYNAADVKVTQRVSHGLLYTVSFTWSDSIDFGSAVRNGNGDGTLWPLNSYNLQAERGKSQFNVPRRLVGSFNYELPFGKDKDFAPSNSILNHIVSGWEWGGIFTLEDGTPDTVTSAGDPAQINTEGTFPEATNVHPFKNPHPGVQGGLASSYWNPAAFACAYVATPTSYCSTPAYVNQSWQSGNWGNTNLSKPALMEFDTNIARTFHIGESRAIQFRLEAFNADNHVNWGTPGSTNPSSPTFGQINTTSVAMRELQGALKFTF